ncbi:MAG: hypothetical protein CMF12_01215 [Idiomarina sp.]|uniref:hypothetical protein n=1 Tax=Idiomarina sp. TaxID=1874361 RepID=UPI000C67E99A|nr:hypothetical protein [Idiomarina sp.]MBT41120.1 hypothetical protein [Idiomarina sp.]
MLINPIDDALYSAMNTIELSFALNKKRFRHESELSKSVVAKMRQLQRDGRINKKVFKYFIDTLMPKQKGFDRRWVNRYARYLEIASMTEKLVGKTDKERLDVLLDHLNDTYGILIRQSISDQEHFSEDEGKQIAEKGFVGVTQSQLTHFDSHGKMTDIVYLSARLPNQESIVKVLKECQTHGFSLHNEETKVAPKEIGFIALLPI